MGGPTDRAIDVDELAHEIRYPVIDIRIRVNSVDEINSPDLQRWKHLPLKLPMPRRRNMMSKLDEGQSWDTLLM